MARRAARATCSAPISLRRRSRRRLSSLRRNPPKPGGDNRAGRQGVPHDDTTRAAVARRLHPRLVHTRRAERDFNCENADVGSSVALPYISGRIFFTTHKPWHVCEIERVRVCAEAVSGCMYCPSGWVNYQPTKYMYAMHAYHCVTTPLTGICATRVIVQPYRASAHASSRLAAPSRRARRRSCIK